MLGALVRLLGRLLVGSCFASGSLLLLSLAVLVRLLPRLLRLTRRALRGFLILSFRLYRLLLRPLAPLILQRFNANILSGVLRVSACLMLSVGLGLLVLVVGGLRLTGWAVGLFLIHGLAVGLSWDEVGSPGGLQLGARIQ